MLPDWIWDFWSSRYDSLLVQRFVLTPTRKMALKEMKQFLEKKKNLAGFSVLDMGCGTGQLICEMASELNRYNLDITGVDLSQGMIDQARKKINNATFVRVDASEFDPGHRQYDVITCLNSFPYYPDPEQVLSSLLKMLKKDGILIITHASINSFYDAMVMLGVKLTVSKASYLSIRKTKCLFQSVLGSVPEVKQVPVHWFIPAVCQFVWRNC